MRAASRLRAPAYVLAAFEGAIVLSRRARDTGPLKVSAGVVAGTVRAGLPA
ncbi:hypothetical protein ACQP1W_11430 [Spirillospora sp. CA-255316]